MNLIPITNNPKAVELDKSVHIKESTFKELKYSEGDLEEFIKNHAEEVFEEENLFIVGQQVANTGRGISDLIAIDENGNIVLIEIKRDMQDIKHRREKFEYQSIRYAAGLASIETPMDMVDQVFSHYIEKNRKRFPKSELTARELGIRLLDEFLEENDALRSFNKKQRIILIASDFDPQTKSAVAWLISNNVDISCYTISPLLLNDQRYLVAERLLPPPALEDFYVEVQTSSYTPKTEAKSRVKRAQLPKMDKLFEWGVLKKGDELYIKNREHIRGVAIDSDTVEYDGERMSYHEWCKLATGWSSVQTYAFIIKAENNEELRVLRKKKMKELEEINAKED